MSSTLLTGADVSIGSLRSRLSLNRKVRLTCWVNSGSIGGLRKAVVAPLAPRTQVVRQSISAAVGLVIVAPATMDFTATPSTCTVVADQVRAIYFTSLPNFFDRHKES